MDGEEHTSLMLTNVGESQEITVTGWGSCVLTLLLVGGGGVDDHNGGAGSGYLEYRSLQVSPGTVLITQVGRGGEYYPGPAAEASSLIFSSGDTLTAQPGDDNSGDYDGGAGYTGNNTISGVIILYPGTQEAEDMEALMVLPEEPIVGMERMVNMEMEAVELVKTSPSTPSDPGS